MDFLSVEDIKRIYPEVNLVRDPELREKCALALAKAYELGGWDRSIYEKAPISLSFADPRCDSLITHIRTVAKAADAVCNVYTEMYGMSPEMHDTVVAGALVHDIGKFLEFAYKDGKVGHSADAKILRHPISGAILAAELGFPSEIVHIIATHSFEGDKSYKTIAAIIMDAVDITSFNYAKSIVDTPAK